MQRQRREWRARSCEPRLARSAPRRIADGACDGAAGLLQPDDGEGAQDGTERAEIHAPLANRVDFAPSLRNQDRAFGVIDDEPCRSSKNDFPATAMLVSTHDDERRLPALGFLDDHVSG